MKQKNSSQKQNQILGFVFIANSILIFVFSYLITLGNSISDGTAMFCLILFSIGTILSLSDEEKLGGENES